MFVYGQITNVDTNKSEIVNNIVLAINHSQKFSHQTAFILGQYFLPLPLYDLTDRGYSEYGLLGAANKRKVGFKGGEGLYKGLFQAAEVAPRPNV